MKAISFLVGSIISISSLSAFAGDGPCKQVEDACKQAGFVAGEVKEGKGLWADCVGPIMQGTTPPKKDVLPLPKVDPATVSACHQKDPKFGMPKPKK